MSARVLYAALLAGAATLALFWGMTLLTRSDDSGTAHLVSAPVIDFIRIARDEETHKRNRKPPRPRPEIAPPPPPTLTPQNNPPILSDSHTILPPPRLAAPDMQGLFINAPIDGDALAVVRVLPHYPPRALARGIEGWVVLEFSLNRLGRAHAPRVVESNPPGIFDAAALAALTRWKYRPRIIGGIAAPAPLVRQRIIFKIDK